MANKFKSQEKTLEIITEIVDTVSAFIILIKNEFEIHAS